MKNLQDLSVIIPLAPQETEWKVLLNDIRQLPSGAEVVFVAPYEEPRDESTYVEFKYRRKWFKGKPTVKWVKSDVGRAKQLNAGARATEKKFVWFLHSDSRINWEGFEGLDKALEKRPEDLHYFDLKFSKDGPRLMKVNQWGVFFRSRFLKIPFGDQGLCIKRSSFFRVGGFDEGAPYGEDHVFVWTARMNSIRLNPIKNWIETSSRKYDQKGWWETTRTHLRLTFDQAFPFWVKLLRMRLRVFFQKIFRRSDLPTKTSDGVERPK